MSEQHTAYSNPAGILNRNDILINIREQYFRALGTSYGQVRPVLDFQTFFNDVAGAGQMKHSAVGCPVYQLLQVFMLRLKFGRAQFLPQKEPHWHGEDEEHDSDAERNEQPVGDMPPYRLEIKIP